MIETQRLIIIPLNYAQLLNYTKTDGSLEKELKLQPNLRVITTELFEALTQTILPNVANPLNNYLFNTLWTMIEKQQRIMVGDLCWVGEPDASGVVEIGYGTYENFKQQGFMTEALAGMIHWAKQQEAIKTIVASTAKNNVPSFRVLEKNGFVQTDESLDLYHWQLNV